MPPTGKVTKTQIENRATAVLGRDLFITDFVGTGDYKPGVEIKSGKTRIVIHGNSRNHARRFTLDILEHMLSPKMRRIAIQAAELAIQTEEDKEHLQGVAPDQIDLAEYRELLEALK